jgi:hypothetical protein
MKSFRTGSRIAALCLAAALAACGGGGGDDPAPAPAPAAPPTSVLGTVETIADTGIVSGVVKDSAGAPVASARLTLGTQTVTSNEQGFFVIERVTPGTDLSMTLGKAGYVPGNTQVTVAAGQQSHLEILLRKVGTTRAALPGNAEQVVRDTRSDGLEGQVRIPANAVVDASGQPVANYTVEITTMLPSDPNYVATFPGRFLGGTTPGSTANPAPLLSYGVINVDLKDAQGNPLKLATGARARLTFPVSADAKHDPGTATVPLWSLDPASGIWKEEGVATRTGSTYVADVSHFSPWNLDVLFSNSARKLVNVRGLDNQPVVNARVYVEGTGYRQVANTGSDGNATLVVRPGDAIRVYAQKGTLQSQVITETAPAAGQSLFNQIDLVEPLVTAMLTWGDRPDDLDSHLTGPTGLHVYYPSSSRGSLTVFPYAKLDTDDVDGFGPEIITITRLQAGTYRFSVHNYSGQPEGPIQGSRAVVNLVVPRSGVIRRYDVPTSNPTNGNLWTVFELDVNAAGSVLVRDVSTMGNVNSSREVQ